MHSLLLISHDRSTLETLQKYLRNEFFTHTAATTKEAIRISHHKDIDIVFWELSPLNDGETKRIIESFRQKEIEPTIIAIVTKAQQVFFEVAEHICAYELVEKPLKKKTVTSAIKRAVERHELKKELGFIQSQMKHFRQNDRENKYNSSLRTNQTQEKNSEFMYKEVFQKFSRSLKHVYDIGKLSELTIEALSEIFKVGKIIFFLLDKEKDVFSPYRYFGIDEAMTRDMNFSHERGIFYWLTQNHQILNKDALENKIPEDSVSWKDTIRIQKELNILQAQICIPVFVKGCLTCVIALGNKITGKPFFDEDIELLSMLIGYIGMAVENAFLYEEVYLSKIHNENVLENIPCGVIAIDNQCKINTFNKSAAKMLNIVPQEIQGKNVKYLGSIFANIILRTLKDKKIYDMNEVAYPNNQSTYAVSTSLIIDKGKELGAIMVFSDVSDVKRLEGKVKDLEQQAFYHMLSRNMSHYIKNRLVTMKTFVDLFPEKHEEQEFVNQFFPLVQNEVRKLDSMVVTLSSLGEKDDSIKKSIDLKVSLDFVLDTCNEQLKKNKIKVVKRYPENISTVYGDCGRLEEAFENIIINAIEEMRGGGTLTVCLAETILDDKRLKEINRYGSNGDRFKSSSPIQKPENSSKTYLEVLVKDTGQGMSKEDSKNVFLPFYTTKMYNIGLGLSVTQRIIEENGGYIYFTSAEGKGSSFFVLLPVLNNYENYFNCG